MLKTFLDVLAEFSTNLPLVELLLVLSVVQLHFLDVSLVRLRLFEQLIDLLRLEELLRGGGCRRYVDCGTVLGRQVAHYLLFFRRLLE